MAKKKTVKQRGAKSAVGKVNTKPRPKVDGGNRAGPKRDGVGGLGAAATVLIDAGKPMRCKELVAQMLQRRLWTSKGKTPAATIAAAITRDINAKKDASRFRRAGPGLFASRSVKG
jgi:hypothetical protein